MEWILALLPTYLVLALFYGAYNAATYQRAHSSKWGEALYHGLGCAICFPIILTMRTAMRIVAWTFR